MDDAKVLELLKSGMFQKDIAKIMGVDRVTITHAAKRLGFKKPPKIDVESLHEAANSGMSFSEYARIHHIRGGVSAVSTIAKKHNIVSQCTTPERDDLPMAEIYAKYQSGINLHSLMNEYNAPWKTLERKLKKYDKNIIIRNHGQSVRPSLLNDKDALGAMAQVMSYRQIAKKLHVNVSTVTNAAKRFHLPFIFSNVWNEIDSEVLAELYLTQALDPSEIAAKLQYPYGVILRQLRLFGFPIARPGGRSRPSKYPQFNDAEWMRVQYATRSSNDIAEEVGSSVSMVLYYLKKYNIKIRSGEEILTALMRHRHGIKDECRGIKCHSGLEVKFLKSLPETATIERNIKYEYGGSMCFIDFKVDGELVEVKPKEVLTQTGPDRRRMIKQFMICHRNNKQLNIWTKAGYWDRKITDDDILHAMNWKLFFSTPEKLYSWLLKQGFIPPRYNYLELVDACIRMLVCRPVDELNASFNNTNPAKLMYHFFPHFWQSSHKDYMPVNAAWELGNQSILREATKDLWQRTQEINIYGLLKTIGRKYKDFATVSWFKPWIAKHIYDKYLGNDGVVIDPCCGWGGRLMGISGSNIKYIGYDINPLSINSHQELAKFLGSRLKIAPEFVAADSSTVVFKDGDLLFTSPPYDDTEYYHGVNNITPTVAILHNIFSQFHGTIVLNVPKWLDGPTVAIAEQHGRSLRERLQMHTNSFMGRQKTFEPILVF